MEVATTGRWVGGKGGIGTGRSSHYCIISPSPVTVRSTRDTHKQHNSRQARDVCRGFHRDPAGIPWAWRCQDVPIQDVRSRADAAPGSRRRLVAICRRPGIASTTRLQLGAGISSTRAGGRAERPARHIERHAIGEMIDASYPDIRTYRDGRRADGVIASRSGRSVLATTRVPNACGR